MKEGKIGGWRFVPHVPYDQPQLQKQGYRQEPYKIIFWHQKCFR